NSVRTEKGFEAGMHPDLHGYAMSHCKVTSECTDGPSRLGWPGATASLHVRTEGSIFCGLSSESGLKQFRKRLITSNSESLKSVHMRSCFSIPTPCSPVMDPPMSMQNSRISRPASNVRWV